MILSILSIPACIVLSSGSEVNGDWGFISRVSLGNIGYKNSYSCDYVNLASL